MTDAEVVRSNRCIYAAHIVVLALVLLALFAIPAQACRGQTVTASWYGPGFDGRLTANGERFNQHGLTAAHKSLPFGTQLRVSFKGKAVTVRINDRGPFVAGRSLDLSRGAANAIGLIPSGVGRVCIETL